MANEPRLEKQVKIIFKKIEIKVADIKITFTFAPRFEKQAAK